MASTFKLLKPLSDLTRKLIITLLFIAATAPAGFARVVSVEDGTGHGFLFQHRGNCFLILPTHVHGRNRSGLRITGQDPVEIGSASVVYETDEALDISLALVRGAITGNCGPAWAALPRAIPAAARVGAPVRLVRHHQASVEAVRSRIQTVDFETMTIVPAEGEQRDYGAGTSGSTVLDGDVPIGMVTDASLRTEAYLIRMDEIVGRLSRFVEGMGADDCSDPASAAVLAGQCGDAAVQVSNLGPFRLMSWSSHPTSPGFSAEEMIAGNAPYIAPIGQGGITLVFEAPETATLSRIRLTSHADNAESFVPKGISVRVDTSTDGIDRSRRFLAQDMAPDGSLDMQRGATYARRVIVTITDAWAGGSPVRLDAVSLE
ncbi:hypothetical protein [Algicella marina]|uniref:Serine protease n=1 Tax=Algicella marina TaxID=2683284 RepID=A0A6P1SXD4_9RHOB|nr:hypothetical protein [Algicella marina]QHQ33866.1 hypothetical protein GO499_01055 [Algicella marina]